MSVPGSTRVNNKVVPHSLFCHMYRKGSLGDGHVGYLHLITITGNSSIFTIAYLLSASMCDGQILKLKLL